MGPHGTGNLEDLTLAESNETRDALAFARTFAFTPTLAARQLDDE